MVARGKEGVREYFAFELWILHEKVVLFEERMSKRDFFFFFFEDLWNRILDFFFDRLNYEMNYEICMNEVFILFSRWYFFNSFSNIYTKSEYFSLMFFFQTNKF